MLSTTDARNLTPAERSWKECDGKSAGPRVRAIAVQDESRARDPGGTNDVGVTHRRGTPWRASSPPRSSCTPSCVVWSGGTLCLRSPVSR